MNIRPMKFLGECNFKIGDVVYYRSPESEYSIRKAKVCNVEMKERYVVHFSVPYYVITLENGIILRSSEAFTSREKAEEYFVKELKTLLTFQQVELDKLLQEMAYETKVLERLERTLRSH